MSIFNNIQPVGVWKYFNDILKIPRPSKKEDKIQTYILNFAVVNNLFHEIDASGNILIRKIASPGYEKRKSICLQSHLDMVCEKNSHSTHDFENDPIQAYIEEDWVKARDTTLGADNGLGIAAQLAILEDNSLNHGNIECLFTVDEETGLYGAYGLESDFFNSRILINLDSEDEGELFIGSAGGINTNAKLIRKMRPVPENSSA